MLSIRGSWLCSECPASITSSTTGFQGPPDSFQELVLLLPLESDNLTCKSAYHHEIRASRGCLPFQFVQGEFFDDFSFLWGEESFQHGNIPLSCVYVDQNIHCGLFHWVHYRRQHQTMVLLRQPPVFVNLDCFPIPKVPLCSPKDDISSMEDTLPCIRAWSRILRLHDGAMREKPCFENSIKQGIFICQ